jgi:hypothetical protein
MAAASDILFEVLLLCFFPSHFSFESLPVPSTRRTMLVHTKCRRLNCKSQSIECNVGADLKAAMAGGFLQGLSDFIDSKMNGYTELEFRNPVLITMTHTWNPTRMIKA